jgi:uncharacterized protein YraI
MRQRLRLWLAMLCLCGVLSAMTLAQTATFTPIVIQPTSTFMPTGTPLPSTIANVVDVRGLAVRTGPYLGASMLAVARPNVDYGVYAQNKDEGVYTWYLIEINGKRGWASGRHLSIKGDLNIPFSGSVFDEIDAPKDYLVRVVTLDNLNLRRRPSERANVLALVPWGTEVVAYGTTMSGGVFFWVQVRYGDQIGWVTAPFVKVVSDTNLWDLPRR